MTVAALYSGDGTTVVGYTDGETTQRSVAARCEEVMKTVSVREMNENASDALQEARRQPVLIRQRDLPAVWMVSADEVARLAQQATGDLELYQAALEIIAVHLFDEDTLSMGQAARLLGISMEAFIELCFRLEVPVLRESEQSIEEQIDSFHRWLENTAETTRS